MLSKKCVTCNKIFYKHPCKSLRAWNEEVKYCSRACSQTVFKKGQKPWNRGRNDYITEDMRKRMSEANKGQHRGKEFWKGRDSEQCWNWKGEKVSYVSLHTWVARHLGKPKICSHCGRTDKKKYEWANTNHEYKRNLEDWIRLCTSCHRKYDYARTRG